MSLRTRLLAFMHVPPAPSAPAGDDHVRIFRAAPNFFFYRLARWALTNTAALIGLVFGVGYMRQVPAWLGDRPLVITVFSVLEIGAVVGFLTQAVWTLALLRLDFEQRWYLVSDRSLRIREGIVRMHEKTMTFANIQHVTIEQGPLQRLLGIADLQVRTAGGGGGGTSEETNKAKHDLHVAYFRGVADAHGIRATIRERLRRHSDAGLGDPDDPAESAPLSQAETSLLSAAHALAEEAHALRRAALPASR